jgi:hypothetical protein
MYTGTPQISYPLYEVNTGKISVPITLSYHASGIKVDQKATWVGLGWSLGTGGSISRQIRGVEDETPFTGWFNSSVTVDSIQRIKTEIEMIPWFQGFNDPQPDFFSYSAGNKSGRFLWSKSAQNFQTTPYQPVLIQRNGNNFQITDDDGTRYYYEEKISTKTDDYGMKTHVVGWNITRIISADAADTVLFKYGVDEGNTGDKSMTPVTTWSKIYHMNVDQQYDFSDYIPDEITASTSYTYNTQGRLQEITFRQGKVVFFAGTRRADYVGNALDSIVVYSKDNNTYSRVKKVALKYDYFTNGKADPAFFEQRLRLNSFTKQDINGEQPEAYQFGYDTTQMPSTLSKGVDWWGFYNGKDFNPHLMPYQKPIITDLQNKGLLGFADREPDTARIMIGMLNRVTYPTGGHTDYKYSINRYQESDPNKVDTSIEFTAFGKGSLEVSSSHTFKIRIGKGTPIYNNNYSVKLILAISPTTFTNKGSGTNMDLIDLTTGQQLKFIHSNDSVKNAADAAVGHKLTTDIILDTSHLYQFNAVIQDSSYVYATARIEYSYNDSTYSYGIGGGIHIDTISTYDIDNTLKNVEVYKYGRNESGLGDMATPPSKLKNQIYTNVNVLQNKLNSGENCNVVVGYIYNFSGMSSYPSASIEGADVTYPEVTKYDYNGRKPNGKTIYSFEEAGIYLQSLANPNTYGGFERFNYALSSNEQKLYQVTVFGFNETDSTFKIQKQTFTQYGTINTHADQACIIHQIAENRIKGFCPDLSADRIYGIKPYSIISGGRNIEFTRDTTYADDGSKQGSITRYTYNERNYPSSITTTNSKGDTIVTKILYPGDHSSSDTETAVLNNMVAKNMTNQPYWQGTYVNNKLLRYQHTVFSNTWPINTDLIAPKIDSSWQSGNDNSLPATTIAYQNYDQYGNIRQIRDDKGITSSFTWNLNGTYPVSQTAGAAITQVLYDGFEDAGSWNGITRDATQVHTGKYAGMINGNSSFTNEKWANVSLSIPTKYRYSGWIYSSGPTAAINLLMKKTGESAAYSYIDNISVAATGKWVYVEKEYLVPAVVASISIRLDNGGAGKVWFDDIKLRPSASQMNTFTFSPLIGMTSKSDEGNHTLYYEFDGQNRLKLIRNKDRNVLKMYCYNYAGEIDRCEGLVYYNTYQTQHFTKNCPYGGSTTVTYSVDAGQYTSLLSVEDANRKALADIAQNGPAYAEKMAVCDYYPSQAMSDTFYRNTCGQGGQGLPYRYNLPQGTETSTISIEDANAKAAIKLKTLGQAAANAGGNCIWTNTGTYSRTLSTQGCDPTAVPSTETYTVYPGRYSSIISGAHAESLATATIDADAQAYVQNVGKCYYFNDTLKFYAKKQCPTGYKGTEVELIVPARHDTSMLNKDIANNLASIWGQANVQDTANAKGECLQCNVLLSKKTTSKALSTFNVMVANSSNGAIVFQKTYPEPNDATLAPCEVIPTGTYHVTISATAKMYVTVNGNEKGIEAGSSQTWLTNTSLNMIFSTDSTKLIGNVAKYAYASKSCGNGYSGVSTQYTIAANTVTTTTQTQAYVDSIAQKMANDGAQAYANQNGICIMNGYNFVVVRGNSNSPNSLMTQVTNSQGSTSLLGNSVDLYQNIAEGSYTVTLSTTSYTAPIKVEVGGNVYTIGSSNNGSSVSFPVSVPTVIIVTYKN